MSRAARRLLAARRHAVDTGEVRRMWPGGAWDVATLYWFRGVYNPCERAVWAAWDRLTTRRTR